MISAEKIVTQYLKAELGVKVLPEAPTDQQGGLDQPWIKVEKLDTRDRGTGDADHFHAHYLQLSCYPSVGGPSGQPEAEELSNDAREALNRLHLETIDGAVVTGVRFGLHGRKPDTELKPTRQRYILEATLYGHVRS